MYRIRLATGHETVFETVEDIARGVSTGTITPECAIFHAKAGKWLPITVHPLYERALEVAQEMAARPARPRRVSRPLPRVDTPSPERTPPRRTRVQGPDPESGGAPPPAEVSASPAAHEPLAAAADHAAAHTSDDVTEDLQAQPTGDTSHVPEEQPVAEGVESDQAESPQLNDGLIDLGPIAPATIEGTTDLIIERGPPPPDYEPPAPVITSSVDSWKSPEPRPESANAEPHPILPSQLHDAEGTAESPTGDEDAPSGVPESGLANAGRNDPLTIGALGDFGDVGESSVDAVLPPRSRSGERRESGGQPTVSSRDEVASRPQGDSRESGAHREVKPVDADVPPRPRGEERRESGDQPAIERMDVKRRPGTGRRDRDGTGAKLAPEHGTRERVAVRRPRNSRASEAPPRQRSPGKTPALAAAGFGAILATAWVLKAFVLGSGADPVEAATLRDTTATLGAATTEEASAASRGRSPRSLAVDFLIPADVGTIPDPLTEPETAGSAYVAAYNAARTDLEIALAGVDVSVLLAPQRWATAEGALASQRDVRAIRAALREFRAHEARIESTRPESELSLRETTPQVRRADIMLAALDSLFGWLVAQNGRYAVADSTITFRGDATLEATYAGLRRRVLDEVYRPGAPPPSIAPVMGTMDSTLFPRPTSIPDAPALPGSSPPADSGSAVSDRLDQWEADQR